jgi:hypothetical protein
LSDSLSNREPKILLALFGGSALNLTIVAAMSVPAFAILISCLASAALAASIG